MQKKLPSRKHPRLRDYDYGRGGYYSVTICTHNNFALLSKVVGRGLAPAEIELTLIGEIVEEQLLDLSKRYPSVEIDKYVIMPTHIHVIIIINEDAAGASPRPTLIDAMRVFKSMSTRICNQKDDVEGRKIWQTSFHENVIRSRDAYLSIWQYIDQNPIKWQEDKYYTE